MTAIRQPGALPRDSGELPTASGSRRAAARGRRQRRLAVLWTLAFGVVLIAGTGLRLWHLGFSPAWQWDEAVYYRVSINVQHGLLASTPLRRARAVPLPAAVLLPVALPVVHPGRGQHLACPAARGAPYRCNAEFAVPAALEAPRIHQGPVRHHPGGLRRLADLYRAGLLHRERPDGAHRFWAFLLYQSALENLRGTLRVRRNGLGFAGSFKQTGVYVLLAVLLCWLITRRAHKGHFVLLGVAVAVIVDLCPGDDPDIRYPSATTGT